MKIKIHYFFILILLVLSVTDILAQTSTVTIKFASPQDGSGVCKVRNSNGRYEVYVSGNLQPEVADLQNVSVRMTGSEIIYSFKPDSNTSTECKTIQNGLEITFTAASEDSDTNSESVKTPTPAPTVKPFTPEETKEGGKEKLDLSVPESPGLTILGLNPQTVVRPSSPREFVAKLINSVDDNGNIQNGIAVDVTPYLLLARGSVTLKDYRNLSDKKDKNGFFKPQFSLERFFSRIQYSLATTKGTSSEDKSARIGTGLHFTIFDYGDPRMDQKFDKCFFDLTVDAERQAAINLGINPDPDQQTGDEADRVAVEITRLVETDYREKYKTTCIAESKKRNFARSSFIVGGAGSWISKNGDTSRFRYNGSAVWTSLAYGFEGLKGLEQKAQLIFHFRRRVKEEVPDPLNEGMFITKDSNFFGSRLRFGSPNFTGNLEGVYQGERFAGRNADSNFRLSLGADYKLADNLYLNFSVGGETKKSSISENKVFVRTSFNWGTSQKPLQ